MTKIGYVAQDRISGLYASNRRALKARVPFEKAKVFGRKEDIANASIATGCSYDVVPVQIKLLSEIPPK